MIAFARRTDWGTPPWLFQRLDREFRFTVDAAASPENAKCRRFWTLEEDGLAQDWTDEVVFCNPPYGAGVGRWVRKAAMGRGVAVLIVPTRTESRWWCEWALHASELRFVRGRVHFVYPGERRASDSRPVFSTTVLVFGTGGPCRVSTFPTPRLAAQGESLFP